MWTYILISGIVSVIFTFYYRREEAKSTALVDYISFRTEVIMYCLAFVLGSVFAPVFVFYHFKNVYSLHKIEKGLKECIELTKKNINLMLLKRSLMDDPEEKTKIDYEILEKREKLTEYEKRLKELK